MMKKAAKKKNLVTQKKDKRKTRRASKMRDVVDNFSQFEINFFGIKFSYLFFVIKLKVFKIML